MELVLDVVISKLEQIQSRLDGVERRLDNIERVQAALVTKIDTLGSVQTAMAIKSLSYGECADLGIVARPGPTGATAVLPMAAKSGG